MYAPSDLGGRRGPFMVRRTVTLHLYGAGSLREVMTQIATDYQAARGMSVRTDFGPSGLMRERIERGEKVDVFASADLGHPLTLQRAGRAAAVAMFTRNTLCAVALPHVGLTTANLLDRLLDPAVKLGTSTPKADPAGDYTWAMFRLADQFKPGSFAVPDQKAQQIVGGTLPSAAGGGPDPTIAALRDGRVDVHLGYCTSVRLRMSQLPGSRRYARVSNQKAKQEYLRSMQNILHQSKI